MRRSRTRHVPALAVTLLGLVLVSGCESSSTAAATRPDATTSSRTPVQAFVDFATGASTTVPWARETTLYVDGQEVARLDAAEAARRSSWSACRRGAATLEGRDCPVSVLDLIRDATRGSRTVSIDDDAPSVVGCNRVRTPAGLGEAAGWIRPDQDRDCFGDFAVAVHLDDAGDVSAVDLALSGP